MSQVTFDEDKEILKKMRPREEAPKIGIEGFVHKYSPYSVKTTRGIMIIASLIFFIVAAMFLFAAIYNNSQIELEKSQNFNDRVQNTRSR
jgi:hypothetical protein